MGNVSFATYDGNFNLTSVTGPTGLVDSFTYDSNGNPLPVAEVLAIAAHELGHMMGLESPQYPNDGHNSLPNHLMTASLANNPTFLYTLSQYEWDALNP